MNCCSGCGVEIFDDPFLYMNGAGEPTISKISIFDEDLLFCPKCTNQLAFFLIDLIKENKKNNIEVMKKQKVISLKELKKNL